MSTVDNKRVSIAPPLAHSVLDLIGNTPLLELHQIHKHLNLDGRLLAKLELLNPGGSKKARVALSMIRRARESGPKAKRWWMSRVEIPAPGWRLSASRSDIRFMR